MPAGEQMEGGSKGLSPAAGIEPRFAAEAAAPIQSSSAARKPVVKPSRSLLLALALSTALPAAGAFAQGAGTMPVPAQPVERAPNGEAEVKLTFAPLVRETAPAVVNVYAAKRVPQRSPFAGDPFFEQFFGNQLRRPRLESSLGSGVVVDPSGLVVTNNHVIEHRVAGARQCLAQFADRLFGIVDQQKHPFHTGAGGQISAH